MNPYFWLVFSSLLVISVECGEQWVNVTGEFLCEGEPYGDVDIELWERDTFDPDDYITTVKSDELGSFVISGSHSEYYNIKPYLKVFHYCTSRVQVNQIDCAQTYETKIPHWAVSSGDRPTVAYQMGPLDLIFIQPGQTCDKSRPDKNFRVVID